MEIRPGEGSRRKLQERGEGVGKWIRTSPSPALFCSVVPPGTSCLSPAIPTPDLCINVGRQSVAPAARSLRSSGHSVP